MGSKSKATTSNVTTSYADSFNTTTSTVTNVSDSGNMAVENSGNVTIQSLGSGASGSAVALLTGLDGKQKTVLFSVLGGVVALVFLFIFLKK